MKGSWRYIAGIIGVLAVLIIAILLIVGRVNRTPDAVEPGERKLTLTDEQYNDSSLVWAMEGEVEAQEEYRSIRITVTPSLRTLEILRGYNYQVESKQEFNNSQAAFDVFAKAMQNAGFTSVAGDESTNQDERGICPTGNRFIYAVIDEGSEVYRNWSTSCSKKEGAFAGNATLIRRLFQAQIPEYSKLTRGVKL